MFETQINMHYCSKHNAAERRNLEFGSNTMENIFKQHEKIENSKDETEIFVAIYALSLLC